MKEKKTVAVPEAAEAMMELTKELKIERQLTNKLACKCEMLSAMVAMKDEMIKSNGEKYESLKWEVLNNYHGDSEKFEAMALDLENIVHGWSADIVEGTKTIATLVTMRSDDIRQRLDAAEPKMPKDEFAEILCDLLPEFRRDYILRVVDNFAGAGIVATGDFLQDCQEAFQDALNKHQGLLTKVNNNNETSLPQKTNPLPSQKQVLMTTVPQRVPQKEEQQRQMPASQGQPPAGGVLVYPPPEQQQDPPAPKTKKLNFSSWRNIATKKQQQSAS